MPGIIAHDSNKIARFLLVDSSGRLYVNLNPATTVYSGQKDVANAGTRTTLRATLAILSITIRAKKTNTGNIFVGNIAVDSTNGFILSPNETVTLDIDDVADVYIDSAVDGEGVSWIAVA